MLFSILAPASAWLNGFSYRQPVDFTVFQNKTDYPIMVNVSYLSYMQADLDDIRFTTAADVELDYWPENISTSDYGIFWVNGTWTTLNGTQMYIYFGNNTAQSQGNISNVFGSGRDLNSGFAGWSGGTTTSEGYQLYDGSGASAPALNYAFDTYSTTFDVCYLTKANVTSGSVMFHYFGKSSTTPYGALVGEGSAWPHAWQTWDKTPSDAWADLTTTLTANVDFRICRRFYFANDTERISIDFLNQPGTWNWREFGGEVDSINYSTFSFGVADTGYMVINWFFTRSVTEPDIAITIGSVESEIGISNSPTYPYVGQSVNFTVTGTGNGNYTKFWWGFGDASPINYTASTWILHSYSSSGVYAVNVTAYDADAASNSTAFKNITIYANLSAVSINIADYVPFVRRTPTNTINYTATGGTPVQNSTWTVTKLGGSPATYYNQTQLNHTPTSGGTYNVSLVLCDLSTSLCASDYDLYHPWNITGGINLVSVFNETENLITRAFQDDMITWNATDSLNWDLEGDTGIGTSFESILNSTNAFWNDTNYYHYNISVNMSWSTYSTEEWFTAIAARYYINSTTAWESTRPWYCFIYGEIYSEDTRAELTGASNSYTALLTTTSGYGHEQTSGIELTNVEDLNISLAMNATPIVSYLTLDGVITYSRGGYAERTYAFQDANIYFSQNCTYDNGKKIKLYTTNSTATSTVTITVLQGGVAFSDALVKVQSYNPDTSTWVTVASQITDNNGQVQMELELCPEYYKIIVQKEGIVYYSQREDCLKSTSHTISVSSTLGTIFSVYAGISSLCSFSNTTNYLVCTISDSVGLSATSTLNVYPYLQDTAVCTSSEQSTSTTLLCDMSGQDNGDYVFELLAVISGSTYAINSGSFTIGSTANAGSDSFLIVIFFLLLGEIAVLVMIHPAVAVVVTTIIIIAMRSITLINFDVSLIGWLIVFDVGVLMIMFKRS